MNTFGIARRLLAAAALTVLAVSGAPAAGSAPEPPPATDSAAHLRWRVTDGEVRRERGDLADAIDRWRRSGASAADADALTRASLRAADFVGPLDDGPVTYLDLAAVGDLDGDGRADTVEIAQTRNAASPTSHLRARRGDGRVLWETRVPGYAYTRGARVGPAGKPGVLVLSRLQEARPTPVGIAIAEAWTVAAYAGDGTQVWARPMPPDVWAFSVASYGIVGVPLLWGVDDLLPGKADDLVLGVTAAAGAAVVRTPAAYPAWVLNGADGTLGPVAAADVVEQEAGSLVYLVPDLSGDGLTDLVTQVGSGNEVALVAQSATGGAPVWVTRDLPIRWPTWIDALGDVTGDRRGDLTMGVDNVSDPDTSRVMVVSGADGTVATTYPGHGAMSLGDVDRDGRRDVSVLSLDVESPQVTLTTTTYDARRRVIHRNVERLGPVDDDDFVGVAAYDAGDVQGDGVRDLATFLGIDRGRTTASRRAIVDGRTGRVLHRGEGVPLHASMDRRGDDLLRLAQASSDRVRVTAVQGSTGAVLWSTTIRTKASLTIFDTRVSWADVDGDRCTDIVLSLTDAEGSVTTVLRGRDGRAAWGAAVTDAGVRPLSGVTPGRDHNRGC